MQGKVNLLEKGPIIDTQDQNDCFEKLAWLVIKIFYVAYCLGI